MKYCDACRSSYPPEFATCPKDQTTLRSVTDLLPGMILRGKYEIVKKLGQGGMGAVYKARHVTFGELRAIKFLGAHLVEEEGFLARFRGEAVVARRLQHPNAVRVEDFDTGEDGLPFIVMEYVEGRSLRQILDAEGKLSVARTVEIGRQACAALAAAHALGVVHRDIKPDNMVIVPQADGTELVKILDFGLAKVREGFELAGGQFATGTNMVLGTPQYMSPEQARGARGDTLDGRADIYSLGVALYELVAGRLPFHSDTPIGMVLKHIQEPPLSPRELGVPEPMSRLLLKALEKDPSQRFQTVEEMAAALAAAAGAAPTQRGSPTMAGSEAPTRLVPGLRSTPAVTPAAARAAVTSDPAPVRASSPGVPVRARPAPRAEPKEPVPSEGGSRLTLGIWVTLAVVAVVFATGMLRRREVAPSPSEAPPATAPATVASAAPASGPAPAAVVVDGALMFDVQRLLDGSAALRGARVKVEVLNGIVTLSGEVPSATAGELAVSLARSVPGGHRVFSTLQVVEPKAASASASNRDDAVRAAPASQPPEPAPAPTPNPTAEKVRELLGRARRELDADNPKGAEPIFEEVLRLEPSNEIARGALDRLRADAARGPRPGPPPR